MKDRPSKIFCKRSSWAWQASPPLTATVQKNRKAIISGQKPSRGHGEIRVQGATYQDLTPERRERLKVSILDFVGPAPHRHRSTTDCGVLGSGKRVRRPEWSLHTHRRRHSQRRLRDFVQYGTGSLHRFHGQFPRRSRALSSVRQHRSGAWRLRARRTIRQRVLDRTSGCLPSAVDADRLRAVHGARL